MPARAPRSLLPLIGIALGLIACTGPEDRGQQLYREHGCAACHGTTGRGDGPSAKRLDVPPRDFADVRAYRQGSSENAIVASIRGGIGAMPAYRDLTESEAADIAAWILSLQRQRGGSGNQP